eukprot:INCI3260.1.p1 GENE.INCI3260.1~~INCI3260.1.p1  ORF type:complete len:339 (-),score=57.57 INCI3260.1:504-1520(-)
MFARFFKKVARSVRRVFRAGRARTREDGTAAPIYFGAPLVHTSIGSHPFAQLVWFLRVYASEVSGLFRVPGEQEVVDQLIHSYENGEIVDLVQRYKASPDKPFFCHAIASTLKRLVRQVPGGFLDRASVQRIREVEVFQRTGRAEDEEEDFDNVILTKWSEYVGILGDLPAANFEALGQLVNFLVHIASFEEVNHASCSNLALCFAPSLADADQCANAMDFMAVSAAIQSMLDFLLDTGRPFRLHGSWSEIDTTDSVLEWLRLVLRGTPAEGAAMKIRHSLACRLGIFDLEQLISEENLFVCFALRSLPCIGFDYLNCLTLRSILLPSRFACVCDVEH